MFFSEKKISKKINKNKRWKILIADNDEDIHQVTKIILNDYVYKDKEIELISAYSGKQCIEILNKHNDFVLVFLDIVMESDDAGLLVVKHLREVLNNNITQVILRTGQAGLAPELEIVKNYAINDYKEKTELSAKQLLTSTLTAIRSYENIKELEQSKSEILTLNEYMKGLVHSYDKNVLALECDNNGKIKYVSEAFCFLCDYTKNILINKNYTYIFTEHEDTDFFDTLKTHLDKNKSYKSELKGKRKDNTFYYLSFVITKNYSEEKKLNSYIIIFSDISDKKIIEEANIEIEKNKIMLAHQSKKSAMGEMIANIAHQWRQPLNNVSLIMYYLRDNCLNLNHEEINKNVENCKIQLSYMSKTIDDFTNFISPNKEISRFNIQNTFAKILTIIYSKLNVNNVSLHEDIDSFEINSSENILMQAVINIINNASDAYKDDNENLLFVSSKKEKKLVSIKIRDNAGGIDPLIISRIFEPYFTTKKENEGIGIGLYIVEEMINKNLNGSIKVKNVSYIFENKKQKGAEFTITLPLSK